MKDIADIVRIVNTVKNSYRKEYFLHFQVPYRTTKYV